MSRRARQRRDKRAEIPDEAALSRLRANGAEAWAGVPDAAAWVDELRGHTMSDTTDQFQPLRDALAAKPTRGPLVCAQNRDKGDVSHIATVAWAGEWCIGVDCGSPDRTHYEDHAPCEVDARAIVAAYNAAPALLAEVERLQFALSEALADKVQPAAPVGWCVEFGAVDLPHGHESRITAVVFYKTRAEAEAAASVMEFNNRVLPLYAAPPVAPAAPVAQFTEDEFFTIVGHASWLRMEGGQRDMPSFFLALAAKFAPDRSHAKRAEEMRSAMLAAAPQAPAAAPPNSEAARYMANELRRMARKVATPAGDVPAIMHSAAALLDALDAAPAEGARWLPIESAPKDGRTILVARHMGDFGWVKGYAQWHGGASYVSGWVSNGFDREMSNLGLAHPTHWMPLPANPTEAPNA